MSTRLTKFIAAGATAITMASSAFAQASPPASAPKHPFTYAQIMEQQRIQKENARAQHAADVASGKVVVPKKTEPGLIGAITVDGIGNEVKLRGLKDPEVAGVTCHFTNFERSTTSRVAGVAIGLLGGKGTSPFTDPSNTSIACRQTGPVEIGKIDLTQKGSEIFDQDVSLIFRSIAVTRFFDCESNSLVYVSHARNIIEGSAKQSVSTVPLYNANPVWKNGAPACLKAG